MCFQLIWTQYTVENATIVAMVTDQGEEFLRARSVEIDGTVQISENPEEMGAYMQNFMSRRPQFASLPPNPDMQENMRVYEITPLKLRMLDNTVAPRHFDVVEL